MIILIITYFSLLSLILPSVSNHSLFLFFLILRLSFFLSLSFYSIFLRLSLSESFVFLRMIHNYSNPFSNLCFYHSFAFNIFTFFFLSLIFIYMSSLVSVFPLSPCFIIPKLFYHFLVSPIRILHFLPLALPFILHSPLF